MGETVSLFWVGLCGRTSGQGYVYARGRRRTRMGEQRAGGS